jgi:hypothetical protein
MALLGNGDEIAEMTELQSDPSKRAAPIGGAA